MIHGNRFPEPLRFVPKEPKDREEQVSRFIFTNSSPEMIHVWRSRHTQSTRNSGLENVKVHRGKDRCKRSCRIEFTLAVTFLKGGLEEDRTAFLLPLWRRSSTRVRKRTYDPSVFPEGLSIGGHKSFPSLLTRLMVNGSVGNHRKTSVPSANRETGSISIDEENCFTDRSLSGESHEACESMGVRGRFHDRRGLNPRLRVTLTFGGAGGFCAC